MNFTGINTTLLMQAGVALGALVVVFYILKLKRRPIAVPFGPLWQRILRDKEATSWFQHLKRLLSLLLQLALLAALLIALGDPRPVIASDEGRHVVVLVDASASMKAIDVTRPVVPGGGEGGAGTTDSSASDGEPAAGANKPWTRLDAGKLEIREVIRGLSGSDRMLIAQMDAAITPLSTMTSEVSDLERALESIEPTDVRARYATGLRFAVDSLRGLSKPEIVIVSDGALGDAVDIHGDIDLGDIELSYVSVGRGGRNVAISEFSVRRYPLDKSRYEVLLEVTNTSDEPADVDLELYGDGQLTDIVGLRIHAKESLARFYPNLSGASERLEARVKLKGAEPDQLPADDTAFALLPARRRARVLVVSEGNMYLDAALLLDEYLEVTKVAPGDYPVDGQFDVTIFDNVAPIPSDGAGQILYLNPTSDEHTPFKLGNEIKTKGFVRFDEVDSKHPIARNLLLGEVNISEARELVPQAKRDKVVGKSFEGNLLLAGTHEGHRFVALGFDIRQSDFALTFTWPLFLINTINFFIDEDTSYISSYRTGQVWNIPASTETKTALLELPNGDKRRVPIKDGRAVYLGQHAGFYALTIGEGDKAETTKFAANISDPFESTIQPREELIVGGKKAGVIEGFTIGVRRTIWIYLLVAVLLVTGIEWLTYHRRLTV